MSRVRTEFLDITFPCGIDRLVRKHANSLANLSTSGLNFNDTRTSLVSLVPRGSKLSEL